MRGEQLRTGSMLDVRNPYDDALVGTVPLIDAADVDDVLATAEAGYRLNRSWPRWRRSELLDRVADSIDATAEAWARLIVSESGMPIAQARKEVGRAPITFRLCAEEARRLGGAVVPFDAYRAYEGWSGHFERVPIGIVVGITPFNAPLNLVAHKVGPALAAGNSIIVKPSEQAPLTALRLRETLIECGMPREMMTVVVGTPAANRALVRSRQVRMVTFTGGSEAAEAIVRDGGVKRYMMELGGNAPVLVLADANLERAVDACVSGAYWLAGQNCLGVQRIFVERALAESFTALLAERVAALRTGDPLDAAVDVGPLISEAQAVRIERIVKAAVAAGARRLAGGERDGSIYRPTVLADTPHECAAWREEIFGPVVNVEPFDRLDDAIAWANASDTLIHAGIFTNDLARARQASSGLEASGIVINESSDFRFDAMPFGGSKYGGVGREGVPFTVQEMTQPKLVMLAPDA